MRKQAARMLRNLANRLDPKPKRWYQVGTAGTASYHYTAMQQQDPMPKRVLADYLTPTDLKKLRP